MVSRWGLLHLNVCTKSKVELLVTGQLMHVNLIELALMHWGVFVWCSGHIFSKDISYFRANLIWIPLVGCPFPSWMETVYSVCICSLKSKATSAHLLWLLIKSTFGFVSGKHTSVTNTVLADYKTVANWFKWGETQIYFASSTKGSDALIQHNKGTHLSNLLRIVIEVYGLGNPLMNECVKRVFFPPSLPDQLSQVVSVKYIIAKALVQTEAQGDWSPHKRHTTSHVIGREWYRQPWMCLWWLSWRKLIWIETHPGHHCGIPRQCKLYLQPNSQHNFFGLFLHLQSSYLFIYLGLGGRMGHLDFLATANHWV